MTEVLWADYAYPGVDLTGYAGVVRYLQTRNGSTRSKYDLTREEVNWHHAAGRPVALFWQNGASSAGLGYTRGVSDARQADAEADLIGAPGIPVHFAVDDPTLTGPMVRPYFQGLLDTLRRPLGAYGSASVCDYLATELGIAWLIQTSSWSAGRVSPYAWLLQRDHNVVSGTSKIDRDPLLRDLPQVAWQPPGDHTMATPPTPSQLEAAGRRAASAAGVGFFIYSGAPGRCRCCSGAHNPAGPFIRAWGPYIGVIRHITAGGLGSRTMETYIRDILVNDPAVPFKSQFSTAPNGDIWWIGSGRANHDLNMSRAAYNALTGGTMSLSEFCQNLRGSELVGSVHTIGIEQVAAVAPTAVQARATDYLVAELCRIPRWSGVDVAGHGEVASDRGPGDPNEHMGNVRTRSRTIVAGGTITPPPPTEDPDMDATQDARLLNVERRTVNMENDLRYIKTIVAWGLDPSKDFQGAAFGEQGEITQRLRRLGSMDQILAGVKQALIEDPDVPVDPAKLDAAVQAALDAALAEGFDAHIAIDPKVEAAQLQARADAAPEANADDVEPRKSEAESDAYEGNDVAEADQLTEREAKARGLDQG